MSKIDFTCRQVLMSAYLYYQQNTNVVSDAVYDRDIKYLVKNWDKIPNRYLALLDPKREGKESLAATSYHCKFTRLVEAGALSWYKEHTGYQLKYLNSGYKEFL